jgi:hypothetical protein
VREDGDVQAVAADGIAARVDVNLDVTHARLHERELQPDDVLHVALAKDLFRFATEEFDCLCFVRQCSAVQRGRGLRAQRDNEVHERSTPRVSKEH